MKGKSMTVKSRISVFALVMLIVGAVDGVGYLPSIAVFGQQLVFFVLAAAVTFLIPTGLISAELCVQYEDESGAYSWSKMAFGSQFAGCVVWLQWINAMVWFPTCLTTLVGTAGYLINPVLAHSPAFLVTSSLTVFWAMTFLNLRGIKQSTRIASFATAIGMLIPIFIIIVLCAIWILCKKSLAIHLNSQAIFPHLNHASTWTSLTAIIMAFQGMELAAVHVKNIQQANRIFPKALLVSICIIVVTLGLGSLAVAVVIPHDDIALVSGTAQAFKTLFAGLHLDWMVTLFCAMLVLGSVGTMVNWLVSPAKGLSQAAKDNYLPMLFAAENRYGVPTTVLIMQALVVSVISLVFFLMPSINGSYWILVDLSTEMYLIMYLLLFLAALRLFHRIDKLKVIRGSKLSAIVLCYLGLIGTITALIVGFFPPSGINIGSPLHYVIFFTLGLIILSAPILLMTAYRKQSINRNESSLMGERYLTP